MTRRRYIDPHLDPMRAPSAAGQHPHTHLSRDEVKNPQSMYESREGAGGAYRPMPHDPRALAAAHARRQQQKPPGLLDAMLANPLAMVAAGAGLAWLIAKLTAEEREPRQNPEPSPQPQLPAPQTTVVTVPQPQLIPAPSAEPLSPARLAARRPVPAPLAAAQASAKQAEALTKSADRNIANAELAIADVEASIAEASQAPAAPCPPTEVIAPTEVIVEKKPKRVRKTTQKHGPDGKFLPAHTARAYYEGIGKKAPSVRRHRSKK